MHLNNAMIETENGNPIVAGEILLELGHGQRNLPSHSHLMLDFSAGPTLLQCYAVAKMTRLASGFYEVTTHEPHLQIVPMSRASFSDLVRADGEGRVQMGARSCGALIEGHRKVYEIVAFEHAGKLQENGMQFLLDGTFAAAQPNLADQPVGDAPRRGARFEIRGLVPWETMMLGGFEAAGWRHLYRPRPTKYAWKRLSLAGLDPFSLSDLRISGDPSTTFVRGSLTLRGAVGVNLAAKQILSATLSPHGLFFNDSDRAEIGEEGFCMGGGASVWFAAHTVTMPLVERLFSNLNKCRRAALSASGDGAGGIDYKTGYAEEQGDPLGRISQNFERLDVELDLSRDGLHIKAKGELRDFDPEVIARHREMRGSTLRPWATLEAEATLPWALFVVMGSSLRHLRAEFAPPPVSAG